MFLIAPAHLVRVARLQRNSTWCSLAVQLGVGYHRREFDSPVAISFTDQLLNIVATGKIVDWDVLIIEAKPSPALHRPQCPICLYDIPSFEEPRSLACGCRFHSDCVALWKTHETHCPTCRSEISSEAPIPSPESRFETNCSSPLTQHNPPLSNGDMCHEGNMPSVRNRFRRLLFSLGLVWN